jgi:hypothetical protein
MSFINYADDKTMTEGHAKLPFGLATPLKEAAGNDSKPKNAFLVKPGGRGRKDLFLSQIGPHNCLNAAAE